MNKRKVKVNVLDFAILAAIVCSIAALIFHDTINEVFEKPEITSVEISVVADSLPDDAFSILVAGKSAVLKIKDGNGADIETSLKSVKTDSKGNTTFVVVCSGYRKLGRYYTETGEKLNVNGDYVLKFDTATLDCVIDSVKVR